MEQRGDEARKKIPISPLGTWVRARFFLLKNDGVGLRAIECQAPLARERLLITHRPTPSFFSRKNLARTQVPNEEMGNFCALHLPFVPCVFLIAPFYGHTSYIALYANI